MGIAGDGFIILVVANFHRIVAQVITQRVGDLVIQERQQAVTHVDQVNFDPQPTEDGCIFAADHTGTENHQCTRCVAQFEDGVRVVDTRMAEIDVRRAPGG